MRDYLIITVKRAERASRNKTWFQEKSLGEIDELRLQCVPVLRLSGQRADLAVNFPFAFFYLRNCSLYGMPVVGHV